MGNNALSIQYPFLFDLPHYYTEDVWDLSKNDSASPEFLARAKSKQYPFLNFDFPANEFIKNELKGFLRHLIEDEQRTFDYVYDSKSFIRLYLSFMYQYHPGTVSILDVSKDDGGEAYQKYVEACGYETTSVVSYIDKNLQQKSYLTKSKLFRLFFSFYEFIENSVANPNQREFDKDTWDVRKLDLKVEIAVSQPYYTVAFGEIAQHWLKFAAKKFSYHRLQTKAIGTVRTDMKGIKNFSKFLSEKRPDIHGLGQLDRQVMEEFIVWTSLKGYAPKPFNQQLVGLRNMFSLLPFLGFEDAPAKKLILDSDYRKHVTKLPEFFSDSELKQLNAHLHELPVQIARMVFVLENVGMRISDICCMQDDCLKKHSDEKYTLRYYQIKTHQYNTVPINEIVGHTIEEAIEDSKGQFGQDCHYVFAASADRPILANTFRHHLKKLALNNNLKFDDGTPFNIKTHTFRGTVATQYANLGIDLDIIRLMLGHADVSVLKHYITIHSTTMIDCMKPITEEDNALIANIGHIKTVETATSVVAAPSLLALPNGSCANTNGTEICSHANACYTCRMFRPSQCHLELYKKQLSDTEANIAIAEINGFERLLSMNQELKENLIRIITSLEREGENNGK